MAASDISALRVNLMSPLGRDEIPSSVMAIPGKEKETRCLGSKGRQLSLSSLFVGRLRCSSDGGSSCTFVLVTSRAKSRVRSVRERGSAAMQSDGMQPWPEMVNLVIRFGSNLKSSALGVKMLWRVRSRRDSGKVWMKVTGSEADSEEEKEKRFKLGRHSFQLFGGSAGPSAPNLLAVISVRDGGRCSQKDLGIEVLKKVHLRRRRRRFPRDFQSSSCCFEYGRSMARRDMVNLVKRGGKRGKKELSLQVWMTERERCVREDGRWRISGGVRYSFRDSMLVVGSPARF